MKSVLFFSRFTFICNVAFLLFVFFGWLERKSTATVPGDTVIPLPFVKEAIVILGFSAIVINLAMNIVYLFCLLSGRLKLLPKWLTVINASFLLSEFYYFFLFKY